MRRARRCKLSYVTDEIVEIAAKAAYEAQVNRVRDLVSEVALDIEHYKAVFEELREEKSDRTVAIAVYALFDDLIIDTYRRHLNHEIKDGLDSILEGSGFLATSHNRVKLAAALFWISKRTYARLNLLRSIRNRFAHHIEARQFDDKVVSGYITSFPPIPEQLEEVIIGYGGPPFKKLSIRKKFLVQVALLFQDTVSEFTVQPYARTMEVDIGSVLSDREKLPENLRLLGLEVARMVLTVALSGAPKIDFQATPQQ